MKFRFYAYKLVVNVMIACSSVVRYAGGDNVVSC